MADIEFAVKDISTIAEPLRELYTKGEDGSYALNVKGAVSDSAHNVVKTELVTANEESRRRRVANDKFKAIGETPEAIQALITDAGKGNNKDLETIKADHASIILQMNETHDTAMGVERGKRVALIGNANNSNLRAELAKQGVVTDSIDLLANMGITQVKVGDDDRTTIYQTDGKTPMVGSGEGSTATIADLAKGLAAANPRLVSDDGKGGGDKPPAGGGKPAGKTITRTAFDALEQSDRAQFFKDGGKII